MKQIVVTNERARHAAAEEILNLPDKPFIITIKQSTRSLEQNALFWLWMTEISNFTGYTKEELHDIVCAMFLGTRSIEVNGIKYDVPRGTSSLKVDEFSALLDRIREWAEVEIGCDLPIPEEYRW